MSTEEIYAVCNACGSMLAAPFKFGDGVSARINIIGASKIGCPCGGYGVIPDGTYNRTPDGIFEVIASSQRSAAELRRIAKLLESARKGQAGIDEVTKIIETELPELSQKIDYRPKNAAELAAYITVILAAITLILNETRRTPEPQPVINQTINVYGGAASESTKVDEKKKTLRSLKKKGKRRKKR